MNIEDTLEELYSCLPNDRNKFNLIMEDMKNNFLRKVKKQSQNNIIRNKISLRPKNQQFFQNNLQNQNIQNKFNKNNNLNYQQNNFNPYPINNYNKEIKDTISTFKNEPNNNYKPIKIQDNSNHYNTQRNFYPQQNRVNNFMGGNKKNISNGFKGTLPDALLINPKPLRTYSQQKLLSDTHANCNFYYPEKNSNIYGEDIDQDGNGWHNQANNIMFNTNDNFFIGNK